jgi:DNA-directed RNA polymerase subunit F
MIKNSEPLSMTEAQEYFDSSNEQGLKAITFVKKFSNLNVSDSKKIRIDLNELNLVKINDFQISKIIDLLPENNEELNKIFTEVNLDEDETKRILDIVKQYK